MNEDDVEVVAVDDVDDDIDEAGVGVRDASDRQVKIILELAMMAGSKKKRPST